MPSQSNTQSIILVSDPKMRLVIETTPQLPKKHPDAKRIHLETKHDAGWTRKRPIRHEDEAVALFKEYRQDIVDNLFEHNPVLQAEIENYLQGINPEFVRLDTLTDHIQRSQHFSYYGKPKPGDIVLSKGRVHGGSGRSTNLLQEITPNGRMRCLHFKDSYGNSFESVNKDPLTSPNLHKLSSRSVHLLNAKGFSAHHLTGFLLFQSHIEKLRQKLPEDEFQIRLGADQNFIPQNPFSS